MFNFLTFSASGTAQGAQYFAMPSLRWYAAEATGNAVVNLNKGGQQ